jgi:hypothetical protein
MRSMFVGRFRIIVRLYSSLIVKILDRNERLAHIIAIRFLSLFFLLLKLFGTGGDDIFQYIREAPGLEETMRRLGKGTGQTLTVAAF